MLFRHQQSASATIQVPPMIGDGGGESTPGAQTGSVERSVHCQHGMHQGHFPVAGMTVREARRTLNQLLNVDPSAVAVINGEIVGDDHVIGHDVASLQFVKKSSVKG